MKGFFREIRQDRIISGGLIITYVLILISLVFILLNFNVLPPYLPLYNQLPWGQERLVPTAMVFLPSILAITVSIINTIFSSIIYSKSQIIARILGITSSLIGLLSFLFIIRTILLIT